MPGETISSGSLDSETTGTGLDPQRYKAFYHPQEKKNRAYVLTLNTILVSAIKMALLFRHEQVNMMRVAKCMFVAAGGFHTVCISGAGLVSVNCEFSRKI